MQNPDVWNAVLSAQRALADRRRRKASQIAQVIAEQDGHAGQPCWSGVLRSGCRVAHGVVSSRWTWLEARRRIAVADEGVAEIAS